jgi:hypothetical protein
VQNSGTTIYYKFSAPDTVTGLTDYFIFSYETDPQTSNGYVYISKISSIQNSAFQATYSKEFTGANLQNQILNWLGNDLKSTNGATDQIANTGVDSAWLTRLTTSQ